MKKAFYLCLLLACFSCGTNSNNGSNQEGASKEYTKTFEEFGFSISAPCILEDVSSQVSGTFEANYGGIVNPDDPENATVYQVAVTKLPSDIEGLSEADQQEILDQRMNLENAGFTNVKKVLFSDNNYIGYVGDTQHNGLMQRGMMFKKGKHIITLTVLTNIDLDEKFNKFTNSFKVID